MSWFSVCCALYLGGWKQKSWRPCCIHIPFLAVKTSYYASRPSLDRQQCSGHISMITNLSHEDGGITNSETLVS